MIPAAKLTDFTSEQLQFAIDVFKEQSEDWQYKLDEAEKYGLKYHIQEYTFKRDTALLFKVQLMNAHQLVEAIEKINNS